MPARKILKRIWQGKITPAEGLEEIKKEIKDKKRVINGDLLYILEGVRERLITVEEAEEEIRWTLLLKSRKNRKVGGAFIVPILP